MWCEREGYEVLEVITDPGQSGASLERPGMDRVRDLVADGGVSVVLAQDRDRFAREPAYHYLLRREFEEHGTKIRALNDRDAVLADLEAMAPETLNCLDAEERHRFCKMLRLRVRLWPDRSLEITGAFPEPLKMRAEVCTTNGSRSSTVQSTKRPPVRFKILVAENGIRRVELARS